MFLTRKREEKRRREEKRCVRAERERERVTVIVWCAAVLAGGRGVESRRAGERESGAAELSRVERVTSGVAC